MGEVIGLDYGAVMGVLKLYADDRVKESFEFVLLCFEIERELTQ